jgi:hypothetical protein
MNLQQLTEYLIANTEQLANLNELCNKHNINKLDVLRQLTNTYKQLSNTLVQLRKDKYGNYTFDRKN